MESHILFKLLRHPSISLSPRSSTVVLNLATIVVMVISLNLLVAGGPNALLAEDVAVSTGVLREQVSLVLIDVVVTDRKGVPLLDLHQDEFSLLLDGRPYPLEGMELVIAGPSAPDVGGLKVDGTPRPTAFRPAQSAATRKFIFFFDSLNSERGIRKPVIEAARHFLSESLNPGEQGMVVAMGRYLKIYQGLTSDAGKVRASIDALARDDKMLWVDETHLRTDLQRLADMNVPLFDASGECIACEAIAHQYALEARNRALHTVNTLRALVAYLHRLPGRKDLILFSEGFVANPGEVVGRPLQRSLEPEFMRLIQEAAAAQVVISTVNSLGLPGSDPIEDFLARKFTDSMASFAIGTGGQAFGGSNRFESALKQVDEGSRVFYVLAFSPKGPPDGKFHSIEVKVLREKSRVRSKQGFVWLTKEQLAEREVLSAYVAPELFGSIPLALDSRFYLGQEETPILELTMRVPEENLLLLPEEGLWVTQTETGVSILTDKNLPLDQYSKGIRIRLTPGHFQTTGDLHFVVHREIPPGDYQVVAVVRDLGTGNMGTIRKPIQVPNLNTGSMAMSSLFMGSENASKRTFHIDADDPHDTDVSAISTQQDFRKSDQPVCSWFIYHPKIWPDTGEARVKVQGFIIREGEQVRELPEMVHTFQPDEDTSRIPIAMRLSLTDMIPGDYQLRVLARDEVAHTEVTRETYFSIR